VSSAVPSAGVAACSPSAAGSSRTSFFFATALVVFIVEL
jgi:hypothetical protein